MKTAFVLSGLHRTGPVGSYEVISRWPDAEVHFLAASLDPVRRDQGLAVIPTGTPATLPEPDLIVVPGSGKPVPVMRDQVRAMGVEVVANRVVWQGNHVSGAGVSAGIDMALSLTERVHGRKLAESLQPVIEYDPQPPFTTRASSGAS